MCHTEADSIHRDVAIVVPTGRHRYQRKLVRSVMRHRKDSCHGIVTVAYVTDDVIKQQGVSTVEWNLSRTLNVEGDVCGEKPKTV